jgi:hypothetical protein
MVEFSPAAFSFFLPGQFIELLALAGLLQELSVALPQKVVQARSDFSKVA